MSRIGNKHIDLPAGVTVELNGQIATIKGPKGSLDVQINKGIDVHVDGAVVTFTRKNKPNKTMVPLVLTSITPSSVLPKVSRRFLK